VTFTSKCVSLNSTQAANGGIVAFGAAPSPIPIYMGPTSHKKPRNPAAAGAAGSDVLRLPAPPEESIGSGTEGKSLGNVSRGDWI
jgi:hypothetical protein